MLYVASVVSEVRGILYVSLFIAKFRHLASSYNLHCPYTHSWVTLREQDLGPTQIFILYIFIFYHTYLCFNRRILLRVIRCYKKFVRDSWCLTVRIIRNVLLAGDVLTSVWRWRYVVSLTANTELGEKARYHNLVIVGLRLQSIIVNIQPCWSHQYLYHVSISICRVN